MDNKELKPRISDFGRPLPPATDLAWYLATGKYPDYARGKPATMLPESGGENLSYFNLVRKLRSW